MTLNPFKAIDKYLKLRTILILRERYLDTWTCSAVKYDIAFAKAFWYKNQVRLYALDNNVDLQIPMYEIARKNFTSQPEERLKFLNHLEQLVLEGKA
jgi:CO dehydrogenase/acetyl-CoA synthase delta subunit